MDSTRHRGHRHFKIIENWAIQSKQLKEQFSQLTDEDLKFESGNESELFTKIGSRLNKKRGEVINILIRTNHLEKV